jgi:hypothetical protein
MPHKPGPTGIVMALVSRARYRFLKKRADLVAGHDRLFFLVFEWWRCCVNNNATGTELRNTDGNSSKQATNGGPTNAQFVAGTTALSITAGWTASQDTSIQGQWKGVRYVRVPLQRLADDYLASDVSTIGVTARAEMEGWHATRCRWCHRHFAFEHSDCFCREDRAEIAAW